MEYNDQLNNLKIAILLTCYNRRETTLGFLKSLTEQQLFNLLNIDIYLLDDGSTDGTSQAVALNYPFVKLHQGTGNLFWAGGMRMIWKYAITKDFYDLFFLYNDDVILFEDAIKNFLYNYINLNKKGVILVGSMLSPLTKQMSYCGYRLFNLKHTKYYPVKPEEQKLIKCHLGNANALLVDATTVKEIGIFSAAYTHLLADFDYTLTAFKAGLSVSIAPGYYGYCENEHGSNWLSNNHSIKERIDYLYSPKGLAYNEYLRYVKKHFPRDYVSAWFKLWMKTLFPVLWDKFKKSN